MTEKTKVFELTSENLSGLGGPMGTERTYDNWRKLFYDVEVAKAHAVIDYGKAIKWQTETNRIHSGDLGYVMYTIKEVDLL